MVVFFLLLLEHKDRVGEMYDWIGNESSTKVSIIHVRQSKKAIILQLTRSLVTNLLQESVELPKNKEVIVAFLVGLDRGFFSC